MAELQTDNIKGSATATTLVVGDGSTATDLEVKGDLTVVGGTTFAADSISGNAITGGTITDFASTGITDGASGAKAIVIDSAEKVLINQELEVTGLADLNGNLLVGGTSGFTGLVTAADVTITGTLTTAGITVKAAWEGHVDVSTGGNISDPVTTVDLGCTASIVSNNLKITFDNPFDPANTDYIVLRTVTSEEQSAGFNTSIASRASGSFQLSFDTWDDASTDGTVQIVVLA